MNCPKCGKSMRVTHSFPVASGKIQRLECTCRTVATLKAVLVNVNPGFGQGAAAMAKKLRKGGPSPSGSGAAAD